MAKVTVTTSAANIVRVYEAASQVTVQELSHSVTIQAASISGSGFETSSPLTVTNTIGDAIAGLTTYETGTNLEFIIRDILSPFLKPTLANVVYSLGSNSEGGLYYEVGYSTTITAVWFYINYVENLAPGTSIQLLNYSTVPSTSYIDIDQEDWSSASSPVSQVLSPAVTLPATNSQLTWTLSTTIRYRENGSGSVVSVAYVFPIKSRYRTFAFTSSLVSPSSVAELLASVDDMLLSTLAVDTTQPNQELLVRCSASSAVATNYLYLLLPGGLSLAEAAATTSGAGVQDLTESITLLSVPGFTSTYSAGTATVTYSVYRTVQPGAFDEDITLDLTLTA
jgi:hypothetical protein